MYDSRPGSVCLCSKNRRIQLNRTASFFVSAVLIMSYWNTAAAQPTFDLQVVNVTSTFDGPSIIGTTNAAALVDNRQCPDPPQPCNYFFFERPSGGGADLVRGNATVWDNRATEPQTKLAQAHVVLDLAGVPSFDPALASLTIEATWQLDGFSGSDSVRLPGGGTFDAKGLQFPAQLRHTFSNLTPLVAPGQVELVIEYVDGDLNNNMGATGVIPLEFTRFTVTIPEPATGGLWMLLITLPAIRRCSVAVNRPSRSLG